MLRRPGKFTLATTRWLPPGLVNQTTVTRLPRAQNSTQGLRTYVRREYRRCWRFQAAIGAAILAGSGCLTCSLNATRQIAIWRSIETVVWVVTASCRLLPLRRAASGQKRTVVLTRHIQLIQRELVSGMVGQGPKGSYILAEGQRAKG